METSVNDISLRGAQQAVDSWIRTYGVRYFEPMTNMAVLTEEVGEVARVMARTYGEQSWKPSQAPENPTERLADELADVLWVLLAIANQTGVDLSDALLRNIRKKTDRDASRHFENPKLNIPE